MPLRDCTIIRSRLRKVSRAETMACGKSSPCGSASRARSASGRHGMSLYIVITACRCEFRFGMPHRSLYGLAASGWSGRCAAAHRR